MATDEASRPDAQVVEPTCSTLPLKLVLPLLAVVGVYHLTKQATTPNHQKGEGRVGFNLCIEA
eukprot:12912175-Prorocentrum_lima.AAC.1